LITLPYASKAYKGYPAGRLRAFLIDLSKDIAAIDKIGVSSERNRRERLTRYPRAVRH